MPVTLKIVNNFSSTRPNATDYFGEHYGDEWVWLYFLNSGGRVEYTSTATKLSTSVSDADAVQLSTVENGVFSIDGDAVGAKLFAALGASNPFIGDSGPGIFDPDIPYALLEWTVSGASSDNVEVSYLDSFSYPTALTVTNAEGQPLGQASFAAGSKAADVIALLKSKMPDKPVGPENSSYPSPGRVGHGPLVPTVADNQSAARWIASSQNYMSAPDVNGCRSIYLYAPGFQEYLQYLQSNEPETTTRDGRVLGWYLDHSGNNGYSGYLSVTGSADGGFGLQVHNIRVNTAPNAAGDWRAEPDAGDATIGMITVARNGACLSYQPHDGTTVIGQWTDAVIYSGDAVLGNFYAGPVVEGSGDFSRVGKYNGLIPSFLTTISAAVASGLLGSEMYVNAYRADESKATMYWFNTLTREQAADKLFDKAWGNDEQYYDPFWAQLAELTDNQSNASPFSERWSNLNSDLPLEPGSVVTWALGLPQADESTTSSRRSVVRLQAASALNLNDLAGVESFVPPEDGMYAVTMTSGGAHSWGGAPVEQVFIFNTAPLKTKACNKWNFVVGTSQGTTLEGVNGHPIYVFLVDQMYAKDNEGEISVTFTKI